MSRIYANIVPILNNLCFLLVDSTFETEVDVAIEKELSLKVQLDRWPSYDELDEAEASLEVAVAAQERMLAVWTARVKKARVVESDYRRCNFINSAKSGKQSLDLAATGQAVSCADTLAQVKDCSDYNADLEEALQPIRGKEATLLPVEGTVSTCVSQVRT